MRIPIGCWSRPSARPLRMRAMIGRGCVPSVSPAGSSPGGCGGGGGGGGAGEGGRRTTRRVALLGDACCAHGPWKRGPKRRTVCGGTARSLELPTRRWRTLVGTPFLALSAGSLGPCPEPHPQPAHIFAFPAGGSLLPEPERVCPSGGGSSVIHC